MITPVLLVEPSVLSLPDQQSLRLPAGMKTVWYTVKGQEQGTVVWIKHSLAVDLRVVRVIPRAGMTRLNQTLCQ